MAFNNQNQDINTSAKIMNIIDENKDVLKEGVYLELSNLLMEKNKEEEKDSEDCFYKVYYFYTDTELDYIKNHLYTNTTIKSNTEIIQMKRAKGKELSNAVELGLDTEEIERRIGFFMDLTFYKDRQKHTYNRCHCNRDSDDCNCDNEVNIINRGFRIVKVTYLGTLK